MKNLALLSSYEADVSFANPGDALSAYEGKREFEGKAATNLRAVMSGNMNYFHVMTLEDSPIKNPGGYQGQKSERGTNRSALHYAGDHRGRHWLCGQ